MADDEKTILEKNIQIKDLDGNKLYPKTKAAVVINNAGENLGTVEAGAQVNKIEKITVNGTERAITDKTVNILVPSIKVGDTTFNPNEETGVIELTVDEVDEYAIQRLETADEGMAATYQLALNGEVFGTKINIPKDMVISGGEVKTCTVADQPVAGLAVGDPFIEMSIANSDDTKLYIPVKDLVDVYTAADATVVVENNTIKVNMTTVTDQLKDTFYTESEVDTLLAGKVDNSALTTDKAALEALIAQKADATETTNALALKANTSDVNDALALKANTSDVNDALALKADKSALETLEGTVTANKTATDASIASINETLGTIAGDKSIADMLADKADSTALTAAVERIAANETAISTNADNITSLQSSKVDATTYATDKATLEASINEKASTADMNTALSAKQDNLTETQLLAVNSGINATKVGEYDAHLANSDIHVTTENKTTWNAKQDALTETQLENIADVPNKASSTELATAKTELESSIATKADATETTSALATKAEKTALEALETTVEGIQNQMSNMCFVVLDADGNEVVGG